MFCDKLRKKIKALLRQFDSYIEANVDTALKVTTSLKAILSSPVAEILTAIIPSDVDEFVRAKLVYGLGVAINGLNIVSECKGAITLEDRLKCFVAEIKKRNPELQEALLAKLASILARTLDDEKKAQHVYDLFVQAKYSAEK
ncbi:hypothetical protein SAMN05428988_1317 [Chitinophaga sp. YR573]|uniref:hypothetical protein n=1 Tax=Chitinophaga sp. YR573 TaxID=1881040 RepID=UPI0008BFC16B|nr:hypothetical protein [Chitinophaga sp. YR573]SEW01979.1 hypothetical protein SAMN05428988_1317 [Chitinophaga sp. YR573]